MYLSQNSEMKDHRKRLEAPHYSWLPLASGKGKLAEVKTRPEFEDQEMDELEMEELGFDSNEEKEEGMRVSQLEAENLASNIVTIAGVNNDILAQTFQALMQDTFFTSNVHLLSILRAQEDDLGPVQGHDHQ
jgi:hypothetical protein